MGKHETLTPTERAIAAAMIRAIVKELREQKSAIKEEGPLRDDAA